MSFLSLFFHVNRNKQTLSPQKVPERTSLETDFCRRKERAWKIPFFPKRLLPQGRRQASLTIEASLGLSLFLLFMVSLCQIFLIMQLQIRLQRTLEQVGSEAAQYCYVSSQIPLWKSESKLISHIEDYLLAELSKEALRLRFIWAAGEENLNDSILLDGADGLSFEESSILQEENRIKLVVSYKVRLPLAVLGMDSILFRQQSYRYGWLGDVAPEKPVENSKEPMVYVTKTGQVYHLTLSCTYLKLSVRQVEAAQIAGLRNESGGKYYACERCRPEASQTSFYITGEGTRYHGDRECSSISRNVTAIPLSQTEERRPCSRCGQGTP